MREIKRLVIHHSASPRTVTADTIESWHRSRGFKRIGYHFIIESDGAQQHGRPVWEEGAHCLADGANHDSIGICVTGNNTINGDRWNDAQIASLVELLRVLRVVFPNIPYLGHRDVPGAATECPGLDVRALLAGRVPAEGE